MEEFDFIARIFRDALAPVIAIVTIYIAIQQWNTNRLKLKFELFDKRYKVFERTKDFIGNIISDADISNQELLSFKPSVIEASFLFGIDIEEYLKDIHLHAVELHKWNKIYCDYTQKQPEGYDHEKVCNDIHKELIWFGDQFKPMKHKFKKYLDVSKI